MEFEHHSDLKPGYLVWLAAFGVSVFVVLSVCFLAR
jgi:hypothetical protein